MGNSINNNEHRKRALTSAVLVLAGIALIVTVLLLFAPKASAEDGTLEITDFYGQDRDYWQRQSTVAENDGVTAVQKACFWIKITDNDLNLDPGEKDLVEPTVYSDWGDPSGVSVQCVETGDDTGIFISGDDLGHKHWVVLANHSYEDKDNGVYYLECMYLDIFWVEYDDGVADADDDILFRYIDEKEPKTTASPASGSYITDTTTITLTAWEDSSEYGGMGTFVDAGLNFTWYRVWYGGSWAPAVSANQLTGSRYGAWEDSYWYDYAVTGSFDMEDVGQDGHCIHYVEFFTVDDGQYDSNNLLGFQWDSMSDRIPTFHKYVYYIDEQAPTSWKTIGTPKWPTSGPDEGKWVTTSTDITLHADDGTGCASEWEIYWEVYWDQNQDGVCEVLEQSGTGNPNSTVIINFLNECKHKLVWWAEDAYGNVEMAHEQFHWVDDSPPTSSKVIGTPKYPTSGPDEGKWVTTSTDITLSALDNGDCMVGSWTIHWEVWWDQNQDGVCEVLEQSGTGAENTSVIINFLNECKHKLIWWAEDDLGNEELPHHEQFHYVDDTPPDSSDKVIGDPKWPISGPDEGKWVTTSTDITLSAIDYGACKVGSWTIHWEVWWDQNQDGYCEVLEQSGVGAENTSVVINFQNECKHNLTWWAVDDLGNEETPHHEQFHYVDDTPPISTKVIGDPKWPESGPTEGAWVTTSTDITLSATDGGPCKVGSWTIHWEVWWDEDQDGICEVLEQSGVGAENTSVVINFLNECNHTLIWWAEDDLGNKEDNHTQNHYVDDTPPTSSKVIGDPKWEINPLDPDYGKWVTTSTPITLSAVDGGACPVGSWKIHWQVWWDQDEDGSGSTEYLEQSGEGAINTSVVIYFMNECNHTLIWWAEDDLGNTEDPYHQQTHYVDDTPPIHGIGFYKLIASDPLLNIWCIPLPPNTVYINASDAGACKVGSYKIHYRTWYMGVWSNWQTGPLTTDVTIVLTEACMHYLEYWVEDDLNNSAGSELVPFNHTIYVSAEEPGMIKTVGEPKCFAGHDEWGHVIWCITNETPIEVNLSYAGCCPFIGGGGGGDVTINISIYHKHNATWTNFSVPYDNITFNFSREFFESINPDWTEDCECEHYMEYWGWLGEEILLRADGKPWNETFLVDNIPPTTIKTIGDPKYPTYGPDEGLYVTTDTNITLNITDRGCCPSNITLYYRIWFNGQWGDWIANDGNVTFKFTEECEHWLQWFAVDCLGNNESGENWEFLHNQTHYVDDTPPETTKTIGECKLIVPGGEPPKVLWDDTHDTNGDEISGTYSSIYGHLTGLGYVIDELSEGEGPISGAILADYDMLVLFDPDTEVLASEITAIKAFVDGGKALYVVGENTGAFHLTSVNTLLADYNIAYTTAGTDGDITWFDGANPITTGISHAFFQQSVPFPGSGAGVLEELGNIIGRDSGAGGNAVLSYHEGTGKIVAITDSGFMNNDHISLYDNQELVDNIFGWLAPINVSALPKIYVSSDTPFNFTCTDDVGGCAVGVLNTRYRVWYDGVWTPWLIYMGNFTMRDVWGFYGEGVMHFDMSGDCVHQIEYYNVDYLGNKEITHTEIDYVDDSPPDIYKKHPDHGYYGHSNRILWDDTHDLNGDELIDPTGNYHDLYMDLIALGYIVHELDVGPITGYILEYYDILVLCDSEAELTAGEIAAIQQWVSMGGRLFVIGEWAGAFHYQSVDALLDPYGIGYEDDGIGGFGPWTTFNAHEITDGISTVDVDDWGNLTVDNAWQVLARDTNLSGGYNNITLAYYEDVQPICNNTYKVVVITDSNFAMNDMYDMSDNKQLLLNIFEYLSLYTPNPDYIHLHSQPPISPLNQLGPWDLGSKWYELYPNYSTEYNLSSWHDSEGGGEGSYITYCDNVDLETLDDCTGNVTELAWYHVEGVTITLLVENMQTYETMFLEFMGDYEDIDMVMYNPWGTWWHEVYPVYSNEYFMADWIEIESPDNILGFCDLVFFEETGMTEWHVLEVGWDLILKKEPYLKLCAPIELYAADKPENSPCAAGVEDIFWGFWLEEIWHPAHETDYYYDQDEITKMRDDRLWYTYNASKPIHFYEECLHILEYWTKDVVCNSGEIHVQKYHVDGTGPIVERVHPEHGYYQNPETGREYVREGGGIYLVADDMGGVTTEENFTFNQTVLDAIDAGLAWLAAQQASDGSLGSGYPVAYTSLAVLKWAEHAKKFRGMDPFDPAYEYSDNIVLGLNYIYNHSTNVPISMQDAGDPDGNGNGNGIWIYANSGYSNYENGMALQAIIATCHPERIVEYGTHAGWTQLDIVKDMVDCIAFGQNDQSHGIYRGSWGYYYNYGTFGDMSNSQWPVLGLISAEEWGVYAPSWVKSELLIFLAATQAADGSFDYTHPDMNYNWHDHDLTGAGMIMLTYCDKTTSDPEMSNAITWIGNNWNNVDYGWYYENVGHGYAMYAVMKAAMIAQPNIITHFGAHDWQQEYDDWLINNQYPDGHWYGNDWHGQNDILDTAFGLLVLQRIAPHVERTYTPQHASGIEDIFWRYEREGGESPKVLWDDSHDNNGDETGVGGTYHDIYMYLTALGYDITELDVGPITGAILANYDILILFDPDTEVLASEITAIQSFVDSGKGLFVVGENTGAFDLTSVNTLLSGYSIAYSTAGTDGDITWFDGAHPVTSGISHAFFEQSVPFPGSGAGVLEELGNIIGRDSGAGGNAVLSYYESGDNKIVAITDSGFMNNDHITLYDNKELVDNIMDWLSPTVGGGITLYPVGPGPGIICGDELTARYGYTEPEIVDYCWYIYNESEGIVFGENCTHKLIYWAKDNVCNRGPIYNHTYYVDDEAPISNIEYPEEHGHVEIESGAGPEIDFNQTILDSIDAGLEWLATQQNPTTGVVGGSYTVASTALAVLKWAEHAKRFRGMDPFDPAYEYSDNIVLGLNYMFNNSVDVAIGNTANGDDPDSDGDGIGTVMYGSYPGYEAGITLMAIVSTCHPERVVEYGDHAGMTQLEVARDMVDWIAWAQEDDGYYRGGWRYIADGGADNSVCQWPCLGLMEARNWGLIAPQFVADELLLWITTSQNANGGFGYSGPSSPDVDNTGTGIVMMNYCGMQTTDPEVQNAINFLAGDADLDKTEPYAMYAVMKAAMTAQPNIITHFGAIDWQELYDTYLLSVQYPDGHFPADTHAGSTVLGTEYALLVLQRIAPVIEINASYIKKCAQVNLTSYDPGECAAGVEQIFWRVQFEDPETHELIWHPIDDNDPYGGNYNYTYINGEWWYNYTKPIHFLENCTHQFEYFAKDYVCHSEQVIKKTYYVDDEAPILTKEYEGPYYQEPVTYCQYITSDTVIWLNATDPGKCAAGVESIFWRYWYMGQDYPMEGEPGAINGSDLEALYGYTDPELLNYWWYRIDDDSTWLQLPEDCVHFLSYWTKDNVCNRGPIHNQTYYVDNMAPESTKTWGEPRCEKPGGNLTTVLWDDTHDTNGDETGVGGTYHNIYTTLTGLGYVITELDAGPITSAILANYDILVLFDPDTELGSNEITAIKAFVDAGGSLYVVGENTGAFHLTSVNTLLADYNIAYTTAGTDGDITWFDAGSPITSGISHAFFQQSVPFPGSGAGVLDELGNIIGRDSGAGGNPVLSYYENTGKIVAITDSGFMNNDHISLYDNQELVINIFNWLSPVGGGGEPTSYIRWDTPFNITCQDLGLDPCIVDKNYTYYRVWYANEPYGFLNHWTPWLLYKGDFTMADVWGLNETGVEVHYDMSGDCIHYIEFYNVDILGNEEIVQNNTHLEDDTGPVSWNDLPLHCNPLYPEYCDSDWDREIYFEWYSQDVGPCAWGKVYEFELELRKVNCTNTTEWVTIVTNLDATLFSGSEFGGIYFGNYTWPEQLYLGKYWWRIRGLDCLGNWGNWSIWTKFTVQASDPPPLAEFFLELYPGWNYISIPVLNPHLSAKGLGAMINYYYTDAVMYIIEYVDASRCGEGCFVGGEWTQCDGWYREYAVGFSNDSQDFPILPGKGYILYMTDYADVIIVGDEPHEPCSQWTCIQQGWNFIGWTYLKYYQDPAPGMEWEPKASDVVQEINKQYADNYLALLGDICWDTSAGYMMYWLDYPEWEAWKAANLVDGPVVEWDPLYEVLGMDLGIWLSVSGAYMTAIPPEFPWMPVTSWEITDGQSTYVIVDNGDCLSVYQTSAPDPCVIMAMAYFDPDAQELIRYDACICSPNDFDMIPGFGYWIFAKEFVGWVAIGNCDEYPECCGSGTYL